MIRKDKKNDIVVFQVKSAEYYYTGGGIWLFHGQLEDGTYFLLDSDHFDVRLVNSEPDPEVCWYADWQEEHFVCDLDAERYGPWLMLAVLRHLGYPAEVEHIQHSVRNVLNGNSSIAVGLGKGGIRQ